MSCSEYHESASSSSDDEEWPPPFYGDAEECPPVKPTKTGWRRLLACIGVKIFGLTQKLACAKTSIIRVLPFPRLRGGNARD